MIQAIYEKQDDIPKEYLSLYAEKNEKWELTGIEGVFTQGNIDRLEDSIKKEREAHKGTKVKLSAWDDYKIEDVKEKLEKYPELETLAEGKDMNEEKINKLVEGRYNIKMGVVQKEIDQLKEDNGSLTIENGTYKKEGIDRKIKDHITEAAVKAKIVTTAFKDAILHGQNVFQINEEGNVRTKENVGVTPGIDGDVWFMEMQKSSPHWWAASSGGGGQGGKNNNGMGKNPFTLENWNLTDQGQIIKSHGLEKAQEFAKSAGTFVGATKPPETKK